MIRMENLNTEKREELSKFFSFIVGGFFLVSLFRSNPIDFFKNKEKVNKVLNIIRNNKGEIIQIEDEKF